MVKKLSILFLLFTFLFVAFPLDVKAASGWLNNGWLHRKKITFNNSSQSENLLNFPVLVKLTSANFDFSKAMSSGQDIRFIDSDNATNLSYEIEKWDITNSQAFIWVNVPVIDASSSSDFIYMYYGNIGASDAQTASSVWNSNYKGVWHLSGDPTTSVSDSTSNQVTLTNQGGFTSANQISGMIDGGLNFNNNGSSGTGTQYLSASITDSAIYNFGANQDFSVSTWVNTTYTTYYSIPVGNVRQAFPHFRLLIDQPDQNGKAWFQIIATVGSGGSSASVLSTTKVNDGNWHLITGTRSGTTLKIYIDGALEGTVVASSNPNLATAENFRIGTDGNRFFQYTGKQDEVRVSNTARSASWIAADYKNGNDTFNSLASEETRETVPVASSPGIPEPQPLSCNDQPPGSAPDLFQIDRTGKTATLYYAPAGNPYSKYFISYGKGDETEGYGVEFEMNNAIGAIPYTVYELNPSTTYSFKVRAGNGCATGMWSQTIRTTSLPVTRRQSFYSL